MDECSECGRDWEDCSSAETYISSGWVEVEVFCECGKRKLVHSFPIQHMDEEEA